MGVNPPRAMVVYLVHAYGHGLVNQKRKTRGGRFGREFGTYHQAVT